MKDLGRIALLQVQPRSLTIGTGPTRYFDPSGLLVVEEMLLTPGGACATTSDGGCLVDVHHAAHPFTRSRGDNTLSFGFVRHYDLMRSRFGDAFQFGCAAENIVVEGQASRVTLADVAGGIVIESVHGLATLMNVMVAAPCMPFAKFALRDPDASAEAVKAAIQFLDEGIRGYYCAYAGKATVTIRCGDRVYAVD